jgi:hypothetical protein
MMAAGWDGAPLRNAPGFAEEGAWFVKWESLYSAPQGRKHPSRTLLKALGFSMFAHS